MNCHELAAKIEKVQPDASPQDVARLCLLLTNFVHDLAELDNEAKLMTAWRQMEARLQATADQHAAMTEELEKLAEEAPPHLNSEQLRVLIRVIKVQSQVLQFYLGRSSETERHKLPNSPR